MISKSKPLIRLMQLSDSALPIGTFSHSFGLEQLIFKGTITDRNSASSAINSILANSIAMQDALACALAHRYQISTEGGARINELNGILTAMKWPEETYRASVDLGTRLVKLSTQLGWISEFPDGKCHQAPAFGWIAGALEIPQSETVCAYVFSAATALVSACVRLVPLGHTDGQKILSDTVSLIEELVTECIKMDVSNLGGFAPLYEQACVEHEHLYTRLFQS